MDLSSTPELKVLVGAVIVGLAQLVWATAAGAGGARDMAWLLGPRDDARPMTGVAARLERAFRNYLETFPLFAAILLADVVGGRAGTLTLYGSILYVIARIVYVPLYAAGVPVARTLAWAASLVGIVMLIVAYFQ